MNVVPFLRTAGLHLLDSLSQLKVLAVRCVIRITRSTSRDGPKVNAEKV